MYPELNEIRKTVLGEDKPIPEITALHV